MIHEAVIWGDEKLVLTLLEDNRQLVSKKDSLGTTPLHYAVIGKHAGIVRALLKLGADVHAKNFYGWTPMHLASPEMMDLLTAHCARLQSQEDNRVAAAA